MFNHTLYIYDTIANLGMYARPPAFSIIMYYLLDNVQHENTVR